MAPERLQRFALGSAGPAASAVAWGAAPCELVFVDGCAYLAELARTVASLISQPGHEVTPRPLLLGVVRSFDGSDLGTLAALTAVSGPRAARAVVERPPKLPTFDPRIIARTLRVGVLGDLQVMGAHLPSLRLARASNGSGWDLPATFVAPR